MLLREYEKLTKEQQRKALKVTKNEEGLSFKLDKKWDEIEMQEIIYVPELGYDEEGFPVDVYTKKEFIKACAGDEYKAQLVFSSITWTAPETLYIEMEMDEEDSNDNEKAIA